MLKMVWQSEVIMKRIRKSGPAGVMRPFIPSVEIAEKLPSEEKILETLEHIAVVLSAIDHNIEVFLARTKPK